MNPVPETDRMLTACWRRPLHRRFMSASFWRTPAVSSEASRGDAWRGRLVGLGDEKPELVLCLVFISLCLISSTQMFHHHLGF